MFTITKEFHFSASHVLHGLAAGHPCGRMHGHNYIVEAVLEADDVDAVGFVRDYGDLAPLKQFIDGALDHRHLNDVLGDVQPSAENIARFLFEQFEAQFPELSAIRVSETPKTWAEYRPS